MITEKMDDDKIKKLIESSQNSEVILHRWQYDLYSWVRWSNAQWDASK